MKLWACYVKNKEVVIRKAQKDDSINIFLCKDMFICDPVYVHKKYNSSLF